jgi:hypothetical protein
MRSKRSLNLLKRPSLCFSLNPDSGGGPRAGPTLTPVSEPTGPGRARVRLRLDDLAMFSADTTSVVPLLRAVIAQHQQTIHLDAGQGLLVSNTRWLHGRDSYTGPRTMLRILGDPLPGTGIQPGFPAPRRREQDLVSGIPAIGPELIGLPAERRLGVCSRPGRRRAGHAVRDLPHRRWPARRDVGGQRRIPARDQP